MSADLLELAASLLGELTEELVFVGGASIHLWISDAAAPPVRATDDVDAVCDVIGRPAYYRLGERLRLQGFSEAIGDPVICRWRYTEPPLTLDVMPTDERILGFSNPRYPLAITTAVGRVLTSGTQIRAASPPVIVATKLAAWEGRGPAICCAASTSTTSSSSPTDDQSSPTSSADTLSRASKPSGEPPGGPVPERGLLGQRRKLETSASSTGPCPRSGGLLALDQYEPDIPRYERPKPVLERTVSRGSDDRISSEIGIRAPASVRAGE